MHDRRISSDGVLVIKAQRFRSQEKNREDALERLRQLVRNAGITAKKRVATRPSRRAKNRRMDSKTRRGQLKSLRGNVDGVDLTPAPRPARSRLRRSATR